MATLVLAERSGILGKSLYSFVTQLGAFENVVWVRDSSRLLSVVARERPDFVALSAGLMGMELLSTISHIADDYTGTKVLVTSTDSDTRLALRSIEAGARGYLLTDRAVAEFDRALDSMQRGRIYVSPGIAGIADHSGSKPDRPSVRSDV